MGRPVSKSYRRATCCAAQDCDYIDRKDEPCWGQVTVIDEVEDEVDVWRWVHACEGHHSYHHGEGYEAEPRQ